MQNNTEGTQIILASASKYKQSLFKRLNYPFTIMEPNIDESIEASEGPAQNALRLAKEKAEACVSRLENSARNTLILACDQVAYLPHLEKAGYLGKPETKANAFKQLKAASGHTCEFHTAFCLYSTKDKSAINKNVITQVKYRQLEDEEIESYLSLEDALDCAGSAKVEGLGISLLESVESNDPSALIGLPLIEVNLALKTILAG